jgi:D-3-phosphoglycerate dehydrogenase
MVHILVPDNLDKHGLAVLEAAKGQGVTYHAPGKMSRTDVLAVIDTADGMIVRSGTQADAELLEKATRLKAIVRAGVGVDNIDLAKATECGVVVMNTPQANTIATAEHTMALMLALARHIPQSQASLLNGQWERTKFVGTELRGKTLGLVGFGRVGQAVAKRALAFEMTVIAYDPYVAVEVGKRLGVEIVALEEVLSRADYLSLHAVATPETYHLLNAKTLSQMKDGVRIINAARGTLVNEQDLAEALKSGKVTGAALDVYAIEPPEPNHPLIGLPNVIDTPHLGASTVEAQEAVGTEAAHKILNALLRSEYQDIVNPTVTPRQS